MKTQDSLGKFRDIAKSIVPVPEFKVAKVNIDLDDGTFKAYVKQEHMLLSMCQGAPVPSEDKLGKLMYDLICLRVAYVNGARLPFSIIGTRFLVPSFLNTILNALGRVESDEFGLILTPNFPKAYRQDEANAEGYDKRNLEEITQEVIELSRLFRVFFDSAGIDYATELPRNKEGDIDMLLFDTSVGEVRAESRKAPGVFAIMAAILGLKQTQPVMVARVSYGSMTFYRYLTFHVGDYERSKT